MGEPTLEDLPIQELLDWLLEGATKSATKGKGVRKVASFAMALLAKPSLR